MALPAFFDPLVNAPRPQKMVAGLFGLVVIGLAAWFLLLSPVETRLTQLRAQEASLQRELMQSRAIAANLARYQREVNELQAQLDALKDRLPGEREMPGLYRTLQDASVQAGLDVALFQPQGSQIRDYYVEIPITLNAEGGYHDVGKLFELVARLPRVVNVKEIKLTALRRGRHSLRAELILATYQYRPIGSPPVPKPGAPKKP